MQVPHRWCSGSSYKSILPTPPPGIAEAVVCGLSATIASVVTSSPATRQNLAMPAGRARRGRFWSPPPVISGVVTLA